MHNVQIERKMKKLTVLLAIMALSALGGCATWSTSSVENAPGSQPQVKDNVASKTPISEIKITEADITERPYKSLGDISVTVNKTTLFHPDPTREMVDQKLREQAYELGADAVVLARYGTVGVSFMSWGSLDGKGRAVQFAK